MLGAPRRRWRAMDDKQHRQANWVLKALLVIVLVVLMHLQPIFRQDYLCFGRWLRLRL